MGWIDLIIIATASRAGALVPSQPSNRKLWRFDLTEIDTKLAA
jgi:hypothetical protein